MDKYGLIGYPLGHSFSISYFNQKFADEGINAKYENFEIASIDILPEILDKNPELKGLNVTIPYKEKVIPFLDSVAPEARAIGAVNVIRVTHEKNKTILKGYNSDVIGFTQSIEPMIDKKWHKKALILGTGGASKAINFGLKSLGIEPIFVSRYERENTITYQQVTPEVVKEYNVIVNCTPVGMYPHTEECPQLPYEAMDNHTILYDLIYNPDQTLFMRKGAQYGADVKNGLEMLLLQALSRTSTRVSSRRLSARSSLTYWEVTQSIVTSCMPTAQARSRVWPICTGRRRATSLSGRVSPRMRS